MDTRSQQISGDQNVQVQGDGNTVNVAYHAPAPAIDPAAAQALLDTMPLDAIPDVAALPTPHRMPLPANPRFVGRAADLLALAGALKPGGVAAITTGIGGVGKTQLASEFAHRYGQYFLGGVFWLSFADPAGVDTEIAACGGVGALGLYADADKLEIAEQIAKVYAAWQQPIPRLLVFDNCEDEALLVARLPRSGGCRVLVTSRSGQWRDPRVAAHALGTLSRTESIALLRSYRADLSDDEAGAIAELLGDLPLALSLAGSYLQTYADESIGKPATYLKNVERALLEHRSLQGAGAAPSLTGHEQHVKATFEVSLKRLHPDDQVDALATQALARAACLAPGEAFPRELLLATLGGETEDEEEIAQRADALRRLIGLGLLERAEEGALRMHRLLSAFARAAVADEGAQMAVEWTILALLENLNVTGNPIRAQPFQRHLHHVVKSVYERVDLQTANLCALFGALLRSQGNLREAQPFYERALTICEQTLGSRDINTAKCLSNLGLLLRSLGNLSEAQTCYERALEICDDATNPEPTLKASLLNNLGSLLQVQGRLEEARLFLEQALTLREQTLGFSHPQTAISLNNMGGLLQEQGDHGGAKWHYQAALGILEPLYGREHHQVATTLNNIGLVLHKMGELSNAQDFIEEALEIREKILGNRHPDVAQSQNNLGSLLLDMDELKDARVCYELALKIYQLSLGDNHIDTARTLNNLGTLLNKQGEFSTAKTYLEQARIIFTAQLGSDHPITRMVSQNLAALDAPPPSAERQIVEITAQAQAAVDAAETDPEIDRVALAQQFEERAQQAEQGEAPGSPYLALAATLRALAARLGQGERPN